MINEFANTQNSFSNDKNIESSKTTDKDLEPFQTVELYPGIELSYFALATDSLSVHHDHAALENILEVNYCRRGRMSWKMGNGNSVYLGQGDISLHTSKTCANSIISLPSGRYEGLTIRIDLKILNGNPPEILSHAGITGTFLYDKFCKDGSITSLAGNERTEQIFSAFYGQPSHLQLSYQKIKVLELLLYLSTLKMDAENRLTEYRSEQIETIRAIHEQLTKHMEQRFTIEALSKQYLMNPTTLKAIFKSVYGTSIASHMKEHRMEQAAKLLRETDICIAEIAKQVGYDSPSRFTAAFKEYSGKLPKDYRSH